MTRSVVRSIRRLIVQTAGAGLLLVCAPRLAADVVAVGQPVTLPFSGGSFASIVGDMVHAGGEAAAVYMHENGSRYVLEFYRFGPDMAIRAHRTIAPGAVNYYMPDLCWDGQNFAIVASTMTRSVFLVVDPEGNEVLAPRELPDIPYGGRTAAFKILWTGAAYAVFGCWLEPQYPGQDLSSGNFYTHFDYWLIQTDGQVLQSRELRMLAPMTYPGIQGAEKEYYDVVWTGAAFFLAYFCESKTGPPFSTYIQLYDLNGSLLRDEQPGFANTTAMGPSLAVGGGTVALSGLKSITLGGNQSFIRFFDPAGTPRAPEARLDGQTLGGIPMCVDPSVTWQGDKFIAMYGHGGFMIDSYKLWLNAFDAAGNRLCPEYPIADDQFLALTGTAAIQVDNQIVGDGVHLWVRYQHDPTGGWLISVEPQVMALDGDCFDAGRLRDYLLGRATITQRNRPAADLSGDQRIDVADIVRSLH